jgi:hypothetical protein
MPVFDKPPRYCVYVLRFWEERSQYPDRPGVWRFSLEVPRTGERHGFASLEALVAFLRAQVEGEKRE